jgi:hypothetical protein
VPLLFSHPKSGPTVHDSTRKYNPPVNDDQFEIEEYRALRAVISQRGSQRTTLVVATIGAWALAAILVAWLMAMPLASLLPLLVLAAGFEAAYALHIGAERIGRYLYVRYESGRAAGWETAIAAFGSGRLPLGGRPSGPLFAVVFTAAVLVNLAVTTIGATRIELAALAIFHTLLIVRIVLARAASKHQRRDDQEEFERILTSKRG